MNQVNLIGRLTKDVELRYNDKITVARFSIAVNRQYKKDSEQSADFINCVAFGKTAEFVSKYFNKGSMIAVNGRINTGSYEKDGKKVYTTDVIVDQCYFCGSKQDNNGDAYEQTEQKNNGFKVLDGDDELPF